MSDIDAKTAAQVGYLCFPGRDIGQRYRDDTRDLRDVDWHGRQPLDVTEVLVVIPGAVELVVGRDQACDVQLGSGLSREHDVSRAHFLGEQPAHEGQAGRLPCRVGAIVVFTEALSLEGPMG